MNSKEQKYIERVSRVFRIARKLRGQTQASLSLELDMSQSAISKIEAGIIMPSAFAWIELTKLAGINSEEAFSCGYIDHALPVSPNIYERSLFSMPKKFDYYKFSKVRTVQPFKKFFEKQLGVKKWDQYLKTQSIDPDFFYVYDEQINFNFSLWTVPLKLES